jgi:hypothetical protein
VDSHSKTDSLRLVVAVAVVVVAEKERRHLVLRLGSRERAVG